MPWYLVHMKYMSAQFLELSGESIRSGLQDASRVRLPPIPWQSYAVGDDARNRSDRRRNTNISICAGRRIIIGQFLRKLKFSVLKGPEKKKFWIIVTACCDSPDVNVWRARRKKSRNSKKMAIIKPDVK